MKKHIVAITERVSATFLFAFLGVVVVSNGHDINALKAGAIAGGLSVAKYLYTVAGAYLASQGAAPVGEPLSAAKPLTSPQCCSSDTKTVA